MLPPRGPSLYRVRGISNVSVAGNTTLGPIRFRFPRAVFVTGVLLFPRSGLLSEAGAIELQIEDESFQQIISDGQGGIFSAPATALMGLRGFHPFKLQRPVAAGDTWNISVLNTSGAPITPLLFIYFDEPRVAPRTESTFGVFGGSGGSA